MLNRSILVALGIMVLMVLPAGALGVPSAAPVAPALVSTPPSTPVTAAAAPELVSVLPGGGPVTPASIPTAAVNVVNTSKAQHLPFAFWGVNVAAQQGFTSSDAATIADTPVTFIRFPGGVVGEEYNYTSGVITNLDGSTTKGTAISTFVTSCKTSNCQSILQLPAEIDDPQTAAYYADYVVNTLHYQPNYWEIGNSVPGWQHFDTPWSQWGTAKGHTITAVLFAQLVNTYVAAIKKVDPHGHFIALGIAMGTPDYAKTYVSEVAAVAGPNLSGISVHSYTMGAAPPNPTWPELLANLNGKYSLPDQVNADRGYLQAECPKCHLKLFVTEANGAEVSDYTKLLSTFAGVLYLAADTTQGLNLRLKNIDWFCYYCHYGGAWEEVKGQYQMQYTLFSQMFTHLGRDTLTTTVTGPSTFYAAATFSPTHGLALLLVNTNLTTKVSVGLGKTGIVLGAAGQLEQWVNGSVGPTNSSLTAGNSLDLPALSITILTIGLPGLSPAHAAPSHHLDRSGGRDTHRHGDSSPPPAPVGVGPTGPSPSQPLGGSLPRPALPRVDALATAPSDLSRVERSSV